MLKMFGLLDANGGAGSEQPGPVGACWPQPACEKNTNAQTNERREKRFMAHQKSARKLSHVNRC
jgi:hypothetical protein